MKLESIKNIEGSFLIYFNFASPYLSLLKYLIDKFKHFLKLN